ncbi:hypothetical protein SanaruYs_10950 [Chryseotalea sanaruensis]|uniref:Uncharacterized protein n=1 Tax=Chryseotalea sanaruensis TaxID=2482724 RepID=A0A401U7L9_9BACT|nr:hypothetical protein [Chryseotalea sanaruensis]GCC50876.1 hypothetical protein SanaruYs_10950 [Chryseotalea sanaruensis]
MKSRTKKILISGLMIFGLVAGPLASDLLACCTDDYYFCESWRNEVIQDVEDNCDGCLTGTIIWIEGC